MTHGVAQYALIGTGVICCLSVAIAFVWAMVETLRKDVVPALRALWRWLAIGVEVTGTVCRPFLLQNGASSDRRVWSSLSRQRPGAQSPAVLLALAQQLAR